MRTLISAVAALLLLTAPSLARDDVSFDLDKTYPMDKDGTLYLSSNDADLTIIGSDRKDVHVFVEYRLDIRGLSRNWKASDFDFEVFAENGNLRMRDTEVMINSVGFISWNEHYIIRIEAPRSISLNLRLDDDNSTVENIDGEISLSMSDGDALLRDVHGDRFDLEADDGTIELIGGRGTLDISLDDGDIIVRDGNFDEIIGRMADGDMEIATKLADKGRYRVRADDGDIYFNVLGGGGEFHLDFDDGRARASGGFEEIDSDDHYRLLHLKGGNARVDLRVNDGRITLRRK